MSEKAAKELGLTAGTKIGSGVIDAYAGWIGTVGAKVKRSGELLGQDHVKNDIEQCFKRLAAVAGTSTCHLVMSRDAVFVPGVWWALLFAVYPPPFVTLVNDICSS